MPTIQQTLEQRRARDAWECVRQAQKQPGKIKKGYSSLARSFPALVQTAGLGQALAFLCAKSKGSKDNNEHSLLYTHLRQWVMKRCFPNQSGDLLNTIITNSSDAYRRATIEALAYAAWLKRFAEAELPDPDSTDKSLEQGG